MRLPAPHELRVIQEQLELGDKLGKLLCFIGTNPAYATLPPEEQERLGRQASIMQQYANVLSERINAFPS